MKRIIAWFSAFFVVMALASTVSAVTTEAKIVASDGAADDFFGGKVSVSGDFAIVGAGGVKDLDGSMYKGAAYIYRYDGTNWIEQQKLEASDGYGGGKYADHFGNVSISGNNAIIGACNGDGRVVDSGAAYIFHYDGTSWVEQQKLIATIGNVGVDDRFGCSVSISGDYAIVGALANMRRLDETGAAYIYHYDGTSWVELQRLKCSDCLEFDQFGVSVAISGEYGEHVIVGAKPSYLGNLDPGAAYIFHYDGINWVEQQKLQASDGHYDDRFGSRLSISGSYAVVGAFLGDGLVADTGSAYIFQYDGTNWVEQQKLLASDGNLDDWYGYSVSISGDNVIVGAKVHDSNNVVNSGAAYLYRYDGNDWVETVKLSPTSKHLRDTAGDHFGNSVAISVNKAIVGALYDDDNGSESGSAYIYAIDSTDPVIVDADNDGYNSTDDCIDNDASINPGASEICGDGIDNNCDGLKDSEDSICDPISVPTASREKGKKCYDGIDNDEDGLLDFADPDCFKKEGKGKTCSDGLDNDGDQLIDCDDSGCSTNRVCM